MKGVNQINWCNGVFNSTNWLYDLNMLSADQCIVHIPLLFLTRLRIFQESYAQALLDFPVLLGLSSYIKPISVDGCVVRFSYNDLQPFKEKVFHLLLNDYALHNKLMKHMLFLKKHFPEECLKAEKEFVVSGKVSFIRVNRLFKMLVRAISINLANPFLEIYFLNSNQSNINNENYQQIMKELVWLPINSTTVLFQKEYDNLERLVKTGNCKEEGIKKFCWEFGFLENGIGDGSKYESLAYVAGKLGFDLSIENDTLSEKYLRVTDLNIDPSGVTDNITKEVDINRQHFLLLRYLQVNEEFRHYWGIRFVRLLRLIAPDEEARQGWGLVDYEEYLEKQ